MIDLVSTAHEIERSLHVDLLDRWFPTCVSDLGGYHQDYTREWTPVGSGSRLCVFQSRMAWLTAKVALENPAYLPYALHGLKELAEHFVDAASGAVAWNLDAQRRPCGPHAGERHAYGHAFAVYALAALGRHEPTALDLAQSVFGYLERHHYDPLYSGYFEATDLSGAPVLDREGEDAIGTRYGWKSQNTHLHLLEAFAELYRVWPDPLLERRLSELIELFLGALWAEPGWLHVYVDRDWTPISGNVSHGHDVEAAHLILDAARALGREEEGILAKCCRLIDYALEVAWHDAGGFFYAGTPHGVLTDETKNWWVQAEGLLGLGALYNLTEDPRYDQALKDQWAWIRDYQIDSAYGGWFESVSRDGTPREPLIKGKDWKAAYHDGRALLFTLRHIRNTVAPARSEANVGA